MYRKFPWIWNLDRKCENFFHNISISLNPFWEIHLRKFQLLTQRVRGRIKNLSMFGYTKHLFRVMNYWEKQKSLDVIFLDSKFLTSKLLNQWILLFWCPVRSKGKAFTWEMSVTIIFCSQSLHWESDLFIICLGLVIETQTFSVLVLIIQIWSCWSLHQPENID